MKTILKNSIRLAMIFFITMLALKANAGDNNGVVSVTIPETWNSFVVRQDFGNQTIFSFKDGNEMPAFLFSVTKVTSEQWLKLHTQVKDAMIIENKDGYIVFVQKTKLPKIDGASNEQYQQALRELDMVIGTIKTNA